MCECSVVLHIYTLISLTKCKKNCVHSIFNMLLCVTMTVIYMRWWTLASNLVVVLVGRAIIIIVIIIPKFMHIEHQHTLQNVIQWMHYILNSNALRLNFSVCTHKMPKYSSSLSISSTFLPHPIHSIQLLYASIIIFQYLEFYTLCSSYIK